MYIGLWRSLVAHLTGGQGVAGSNPVNPTDKAPEGFSFRSFFCMPFSGFCFACLDGEIRVSAPKTRLEALKGALFLGMAGEGPALHL